MQWSRDDWTLAAFALVFTVFLLSFSHFADFGVYDGGTWYKTTLLTESTFHQGLINSIKDTFPPPALYAAGSADFSSYHLNMHLQIEGMHRLIGIGTDRLVFWYFPLLYFMMLFLLPVAFVRDRGGALVAAAVAGMLVFGTGLSFLPGFLGLADPSFAWVQFFHPDIMSLFTLNGLIPALIALFIVLLVFPSSKVAQGRWFWWALALVLVGAYGFKSSMGAQVAGVLLAVGALRFLIDKEHPRDWGMAACGAVALALMALDQALLRDGLGQTVMEFRPWHPLNAMLYYFGLEDVQDGFKPLWFVLFMLGGLGIRVLGFLSIKETLRKQPGNGWLVLFIVIFFFSGYALADVLYLGDSSYDFNHASWFAIQGLFASWYLLYLLMARLDADKSRLGLILACLLLLSYPSTIQLLVLKADSGVSFIEPDDQELVEYLESTDPSAVVMHPLNIDRPSLASNLAGRSTVLTVSKSFVNDSQGLEQRVGGVVAFYAKETDNQTRQAILDYYGVTHVYGSHEFDDLLTQMPRLERVFSNGSYSVWRVSF